MFYLKYDDIEGLFSEAAENYQINADEAFDWDRINRSIHDGSNEEKKPEPEKDRKRRFMFWFFLLFSIGLLSYNIWSIESEKKLLQQNISQNKSSSNNNVANNNAGDRNENNNSKSRQINDAVVNKNKSAKTFATADSNGKQKLLTIENLQEANNSGNINDNITQNKIANADINPTPLSQKNILLHGQTHNIEKNIPDLINPLNKTSSIQSSKKNNSEKNSRSKFYIGAFVAPDVTFVEFQKANGLGATFGLTAGYQFNKNWSIESGISLNTKKYYTDGEYFDKSNVPDFYNAQLLSVDGSCNMIEVPLNIRYKFSSNSNHNFTVAAGTSSYFMTKESYNYSMIAWGQPVQGNFTNHPSSANWFSVINLSAGYEKKLNNLSLLIEPYYKAAVKGIGTGNLNMSSAGINIGIKKYFGKK